MPFVPLNSGVAFVDGDEWSLQVGDLVRTDLDNHETRIDTLESATPSASDSFTTIAVSGQSNIVADSATDTLTLVAGSNITLTTNATTDTLTIAASGGSSDSFKTIAVSGQSDVVADSSTDTLTLVAGTNVTLTTNASTDTVTIAASGGTGTVTHTGGALTANELVIGAGSADLAVLGSLGTATTLLHGNAGGAPTFAAVDLAADVTGNLPYTNIVPASAASLLVGRGSAAGAGDWHEIVLGSNLLMSGATLSATGGLTGTWSVLTNGDVASPELVFAGGDVVMVFVP